MDTAQLGEGGEGRGHLHVPEKSRIARRMARPADSYGLVLLLVVLDYVAVSLARGSTWGNVGIVVLQGLTLFFTLRTSRAPSLWVLLAGVFLVAGTVVAVADVLLSVSNAVNETIRIIGGVLLLVTPVAIVRRIATHRVVTAETLLGAVCVYVLIGLSFSSLYTAVAFFSPTPFFAGVPHATGSAFLFFSYTTLTTVGYGNLVPASNLGQTLAMLEAMLGQIYLVIVVSRLVSLWGQEIPRNTRTRDTTDDDA